MTQLTLTRLAKILKSEWLLVIAILLSFGLFALSLLIITKPEKGVPWQEDIYAGSTNRQELESKLGPPAKIEGQGQNLIYSYPSENPYRNHEVIMQEDVVSLIKERVISNEKGKLQDYLQKYGQPETKLFGEYGTAAPGHYWGNQGILVFANQFDGTIIDIWYFAPIQVSEFLTDHPSLNQSAETTDKF